MSRPAVTWDERRGVWVARPYLGISPSTGKPIRPQRDMPGPGRDEQELAQAMAEEWYDMLTAGGAVVKSRRLSDVLRAYVAWMDAEGRWAPSTTPTYLSVIRAQIDPTVGSADVDDMSAWAVSGLYASLMRPVKGREPLSTSSVIKLHWLLTGAWRWMVKNGITESNPMPSVGKPSPVRSEAAMLTMTEFASTLSAIEGVLSAEASSAEAVRRRNAAMAAYMALTAAFRAGEACGISREQSRVSAADPHWYIHDQISEKPRLARRVVKRGSVGRVSMTAADAEVARAHMAWQEGYLGPRAADDRRLTLVTDHDGSWMRPSELSSEFAALRDRLGLDKSLTPHSLRHTHASYLIAEGEDILTIQRRLRHADITTTLRIYGHLMPGSDMRAAEGFGRVMSRMRRTP